MKTALVVVAHPDDEILGCGATVAKMCSEGWEVHHLILAEGITSRANVDLAALKELQSCAIKASQILGVSSVGFGGFADNRMDGVDLLDVVKVVEERIRAVQPTRVLTHHYGDVNVDHRIVHEAVAAATRPLPDSPVKQVIFFEVPSSTEWRMSGSSTQFVPNLFVDITGYLSRKLDALDAYKSEMRAFPHPRSIIAVEHLAAWRGAAAGLQSAEAFHVGRWIV